MRAHIEIPLLDKGILEKYEVHVVGGTLRDYLLGRPFNDFDLVVRNAPQFLRDLKEKNKGITVFPLSEEDKEYRCVISENLWFDVTEFKGVDVVEDLGKRDFTINAMAFNPKTGEIIDPFGGYEDLQKGLIRSLGPVNLLQDTLRILRAYRFRAILGFRIEPKTRAYLKEFSPLVSTKYVAGERVRYELFLMLKVENAHETLKEMAEDGVLFYIFPELSALKVTSQRYYNEQNLFYHTFNALQNLESILSHRDYSDDLKVLLKLAILLHDIGKPLTLSYDEDGNTHFYGHDRVGAELVDLLADRIKLSKKERTILKKLVRHHMYPHLLAAQKNLTERAVNRYLRRMEELAFPLLDMAVADAMASPPRGEGILPYDSFKNKMLAVIEEKNKISPGRLITGYDLIELGLQPGPIFKVILAEIDDLVAEGRVKSKEEALEYIKSKYLSQSR